MSNPVRQIRPVGRGEYDKFCRTVYAELNKRSFDPSVSAYLMVSKDAAIQPFLFELVKALLTAWSVKALQGAAVTPEEINIGEKAAAMLDTLGQMAP